MESQRKNPGTFFPWPGEKQSSEKGITLRVLTGAALDGLNEQTTEERNVVIDGVLYKDREITDPGLRERLRLDYVIVDWKGYTDNGEEIPCTMETKYEAMKHDPVFARFVIVKLEELQDLLDKRAGLVRKNVERSRSGS